MFIDLVLSKGSGDLFFLFDLIAFLKPYTICSWKWKYWTYL